MKQITVAFLKAQQAFAPAIKSAKNEHYRTKYATLASCIDAVIDALHANGIAFTQKTHDCDNGIAIETLLMHESGEILTGGILHVPASKQDPQGYGSALTYARRYSLMATCGIAPEDDDGESASAPVKPQPRVTVKPAEQVRKGKTLEQIAPMIADCTTLAALQMLYAGLTEEEKALAQSMFTARKGELAK